MIRLRDPIILWFGHLIGRFLYLTPAISTSLIFVKASITVLQHQDFMMLPLVRTCPQSLFRFPTPTHVHTHTHTRTPTRTHSHPHTHTHTRTRTKSFFQPLIFFSHTPTPLSLNFSPFLTLSVLRWVVSFLSFSRFHFLQSFPSHRISTKFLSPILYISSLSVQIQKAMNYDELQLPAAAEAATAVIPLP